MFRKFYNPTIRSAAIGCLLLVFALSVSWATINYYSVSKVVRMSKQYIFDVVRGKGKYPDAIRVQILYGTLDAYMVEKGINKVEITVDLVEEEVTDANGTYYRLDFTFGPSGAYFEPKSLKLRLHGKYASEQTVVWLYNEYGEAVQGTRLDEWGLVIFDIPHFSSYHYDDYDY